jgi:hypothetical protein
VRIEELELRNRGIDMLGLPAARLDHKELQQ